VTEEKQTEASFVMRIPVNKNSVMLAYLAEVYHADIADLVYLYSVLGKDLFKFFFVLAGKQVSVPGLSKQFRMFQFAGKASIYLNGEVVPSTAQEARVVEMLKKMWDKERNEFVIGMEVGNGSEQLDPEVSPGKNEFPLGGNPEGGSTGSGDATHNGPDVIVRPAETVRSIHEPAEDTFAGVGGRPSSSREPSEGLDGSGVPGVIPEVTNGPAIDGSSDDEELE